jgi:predicted DNA-binding protein with PD1-like motif
MSPLLRTLIWALATVRVLALKMPDELWYEEKLMKHETGIFTSPRIHVLRLSPGEYLLESIWKYARVNNIKAASILTTVGSLTTANIRFANDDFGTALTGHFEIVSLVGNIDLQPSLPPVDGKGSGHVHISISDERGATFGGHLLSGSVVYTTAEVTFVEISDAVFKRVLDDGPSGSGYNELKVFPVKSE